MIINDIQFNVELEDILIELMFQLRVNNIDLIWKYRNGPRHIQVCRPYHNNEQEREQSAGIRKDDGIFHPFTCGKMYNL